MRGFKILVHLGLWGEKTAFERAHLFVGPRKNKAILTTSRQLKFGEPELASASKISLDKLFEQMKLVEAKEFRIVLRNDVQCTL